MSAERDMVMDAISALPAKIELDLPGTRQMRRRLVIELETRLRSRVIRVAVFQVRSKRETLLCSAAPMLAFTVKGIDRCRLSVEGDLWVGSAAFELTPAERTQIRERFAPLGLSVECAS